MLWIFVEWAYIQPDKTAKSICEIRSLVLEILPVNSGKHVVFHNIGQTSDVIDQG